MTETRTAYAALTIQAQQDLVDALLNDAKTGFQDVQGAVRDGNLNSASVSLDQALDKARHARQELTMLMDKQTETEMRNKIADILKYFINNKERMRYDKYKQNGLCIGSGAIESANKFVIQRRVKLQGMRWDEDNANYMVHLRAEYINKQMDAHYGIKENPLLSQIAVT